MYTLVGQKCGTVLLDPRTTGVVNSEAVSRQSTSRTTPWRAAATSRTTYFVSP